MPPRDFLSRRDADYEERMARALLSETERRIAAPGSAERRRTLETVARGLAREAEFWREQRLHHLRSEAGK